MLLFTGQIRCSHIWKPFYWNHHNVHRGESHIPLILTDYGWSGDQLELLSRLKDPDKVATILTSFDLTESYDEKDLMNDDPAFKALETVPHAISEQQWWARYRKLFERRLKPNPSLQRTSNSRHP
jgi:hypothetical protein